MLIRVVGEKLVWQIGRRMTLHLYVCLIKTSFDHFIKMMLIYVFD
jgi:hypothetical protein